MRTVRQHRALGVVLAAGLLVLGACGYDTTELPKPKADQTTAGSSTTPVQCDDATESYAPRSDRAAARAELGNDGLLVVGVSADTIKLGSANPFEKFEIQGFDIDVARAIADALDVDLRLQVISAADRIAAGSPQPGHR